MPASMNVARTKSTPSYCPACQRLYRVTPRNYVCPADQTPLIDVSDPLPGMTQKFIPVIGLGMGLVGAAVAFIVV